MMYSAQKQHIVDQRFQQLQLSSLATQPQPQPAPMATETHAQGAQASLHSFWKLPKAAAPSAAAVPPLIHRSMYEGPTNCEDCGQTLRDEASSEDAMDVDNFGAEAETGCSGCGKHVCSHCSITNLGQQRRCLICAGKKVWIGGLGWAGVSGVKAC